MWIDGLQTGFELTRAEQTCTLHWLQRGIDVMATNLGQNASNKTSRSVAHCVRHQSQKTMKSTNFLHPWAMFISRERKPKSRQIPPTPTMDMLGVHCSDPSLPGEFEDLIRSSSDPQTHPQRRLHCFFLAFLTSLRIRDLGVI